MSLVSYFLAKNQDVQEQLYREVMDAIALNDGNEHLDYNAIQSLPYLDQVTTFRHYCISATPPFSLKSQT